MGTRRIDLREEGFIPKGGVPSWKEQRQMFVELDKNMVRGYMPHSKRIGIVKKDRCVDYSGLQSEEVSGFRSLVEKVGGIGALKGYDKRKSGGMIHLSEGANFSHREIQQPGYKVFFRNARGKELFDKLTKINLGLVARVAGRNLDLGDLDELFQAVSPTLSKAVEEFDYTRGTVFSTCAYTFLNNKFLDIRERGGLNKESYSVADCDENDVRVVPSNSQCPNIIIETKEFVWNMMDLLSEKQRRVMDWLFLQGKDLKEVAEFMGFTSAGVGVIRDKALGAIWRHLVRKGYELPPHLSQKILAYARA